MKVVKYDEALKLCNEYKEFVNKLLDENYEHTMTIGVLKEENEVLINTLKELRAVDTSRELKKATREVKQLRDSLSKQEQVTEMYRLKLNGLRNIQIVDIEELK
jgi:predicted RNase H-like nuclease (RuvC/YqgF family)